MRIEITDYDRPGSATVVRVTLSRRNLLSLLHKLDVTDSRRTLMLEGPITLVVHAEHDGEHYLHRDPGPMVDETEDWLAQRSYKD